MKSLKSLKSLKLLLVLSVTISLTYCSPPITEILAEELCGCFTKVDSLGVKTKADFDKFPVESRKAISCMNNVVDKASLEGLSKEDRKRMLIKFREDCPDMASAVGI
jgi:hypothetical protein